MGILVVLALHALAAPPLSQLSLPQSGESETAAAIVELERRRAEAIAARNTGVLSKLLSHDSRFITADGQLLDRTGRLAAISRGEVVERTSPAVPPTIRVYETIALVSGRVLHGRSADPAHVHFLRVWVRESGGWRIFLTHDTDITPHATADPPTVAELDAPVPAGRVDAAPVRAAKPGVVMATLRRSHRLYWAKDAVRYRRYAGDDLVRAAETGVRPGAELIAMMQRNPRLPAPPSEQLEMWARVFGSVAVGGWLDAGETDDGQPSLNRFTAVLVWRDGRWQIVQLQSNGMSGAGAP